MRKSVRERRKNIAKSEIYLRISKKMRTFVVEIGVLVRVLRGELLNIFIVRTRG